MKPAAKKKSTAPRKPLFYETCPTAGLDTIEYVISCDKENFIMNETYVGKDAETREDKIQKGRTRYFGNIESMMRYIVSNEAKLLIAEGAVKDTKDCLEFFKTCQADIIKKIKFPKLKGDE